MDITGGNNNSIQLDFFILQLYVPFSQRLLIDHYVIFHEKKKKKFNVMEYVRVQ